MAGFSPTDAGYGFQESQYDVVPQQAEDEKLNYGFGSMKIHAQPEDTQVRAKGYAVARADNPDNVYRMDFPKRGRFILINNRYFTDKDDRAGTERDAKCLSERFEELGFEVIRKDDQTAAEMIQVVQEISEMNHANCDMFAMAVLSHGKSGLVHGMDCSIELDELFAPLRGNKCKTLIGKPKLVIIQACRGFKYDAGVETTDADSEADICTIPKEADFLFAHATALGYRSWRDEEEGSCFIQTLSEVLAEKGHVQEIVNILTHNNRCVAEEFQSTKGSEKSVNLKKQMPSFSTQLRKELYMPKKLNKSFLPGMPVGSLEGLQDKDHCGVYKMDRRNRGLFYVINNKEFDGSTNLNTRSGTDMDRDELHTIFSGLGFEVHLHNNLSMVEMLRIVIAVSKIDHSEYDMFAMAILSYGDVGSVYGTDGRIEVDRLFAPLKGNDCQSLVGKPKFFIIQACQIEDKDKGDKFGVEETTEKTEGGNFEKRRLPIEADILYVYSTCPGRLSWGITDTGCCQFIETLCEVLREHGHTHEIMWILTRANLLIAAKSEKDQMPSIVSQLTYNLYLPEK